jgi:hypothetical protein
MSVVLFTEYDLLFVSVCLVVSPYVRTTNSRCTFVCLYTKFGGSSTTEMTKFLNLNLDSGNLLTKWLLDFRYLDLNLDFANILTTMVIGLLIFGFEF